MDPVKRLRLLADNGAPLILTTEKTNPYEQTVHVQGRGSFTVNTHLDKPAFVDSLRSDLQHYPNRVSINGEPVMTSPFPDLAKVLITSYEQHTTEYPNSRSLALEEGYSHTHRQNALIAGVLSTINPPSKSAAYLTAGENLFPHWQPLHKVTMTPVSMVTKEEFNSLTDTEATLLLEGDAILPFNRILAQRDDEQVQRTIEHPAAPRKYEGAVHHYAISHPSNPHNSQPFNTGEPIAVHRTPVAIDPAALSNPEFISAAEALYTSDQDLVPVDQRDNPTRTVTDLTAVVHTGQPEGKSCLQPADSITLHFGLDKNPPDREVQARLWMTKDELLNGIETISYVPQNMDPNLDVDYMTKCLIRAYWSDDHSTSQSGEEDDMAQLAFNMKCLANSALVSPAQAYREQLQLYVEGFSSDLPPPNQEITVTSPYHNISMTYRPSAGTE